MTLEAGATLGRFRITALLGAGGMGVVYRARDPLLQRDVALKVLSGAGPTGAAVRAELVREARAAAALNHPNICTIYEVVEAGPDVCIAMECLDGSRLDEVIQRERLDSARLIDLGLQLAGAVAQAHRAGIVHRDLKSANVVLTREGRVKVLDFGIAQRRRTMSDATESAGQAAVEAVAGTLPYMAPEVLRGEPATNRSDVWSLGVVLHEMASGQRPFQGRSAAELTSSILRDPPAALPDGTPPAFAAVIRRSLAKSPSERYADAGEVHAALETMTPVPATNPGRSARLGHVGAAALMVAVLAVLAAGAWFWSRWSSRPGVESLAVLPFENVTRDPSQEFFADGMTGELTTTLAQLARLTVISRTSSARFKGSRDPLPQIARALGADVLLEGSVLRDGDRVRINVQLIDGATDRNLWAQSFERDYGDVLALQTEIARAVAGQVSTRLNTPAPVSKITPRAYDAYLLGRAYTRQRNAEFMDKAVESLQQAVALEPSWAAAHAALAEAYRERDVWAGVGIGKSADLIRAEAERAVALDGTLAEGHLALARLQFDHDWNWTAGEAGFKRALALNPSLGEADVAYALLLQTLGRHDEAIASARRGIKLEPLSPSMLSDYGRVLYRARRYEESADAYKEALRLDPEYTAALGRLLSVQAVGNQVDEIRATTARLRPLEGRLPPYILEMCDAFLAWRLGKADEVRRIAARIEESARPRGGERAIVLAMMYAVIDDRDRAVSWLERGVAERSLLPLQLRDPLLDGVRGDARFKALLKRANLPE